MTTVSDLIDQTSAILHSYTGVIDQTTYLTETLSSSATTVPVAHPDHITRGFIEIDDELLQVATVGAGSAELMPFGRGAQNTTAITHAVNSKVTNDPLVPRRRIFEALQQTVRQVTPPLFAIKTHEFTFLPTQATYELPVDVDRILRVSYEAIGPSQVWPVINRYTLDPRSTLTSARAITLNACLEPGRTVQVVYAASLPVPASVSIDLETSGIPAEMHDMLMYGACWRLVQSMDPARLQLRSVEQQMRAQGVEPGAASKVAQQFLGMFMQRREEERQRLLTLFPPTAHHVR